MKSNGFSHYTMCAMALAIGTGLGGGCAPSDDSPLCDDGFVYDSATGSCELASTDPTGPTDPTDPTDPTEPDAYQLTSDEIAALPSDTQALYDSGALTAYYTLFEMDLYNAYSTTAQNNIYYVSEMADDTFDPTEFFLALATDYWCCDREKWGGSNQSECYENRNQEMNYCNANSSEDCYQWGGSEELLYSGDELTGYCANETIGPCFPCETIKDNFSSITETATTVLEELTSVNSADFNNSMNAFIDVLRSPVMGAVSLVDELGNVEYVVIQDFYIPYGEQSLKLTLPESSQPYTTSSGSMTLPVGTAGYQLLNDVLLPMQGLESGVAGIITGSIVDTACSRAPLGTQTICRDQLTDFAEDKVNDLLTGMASNVTLEVGQVTMSSPIAASGGTVTMSANGQSVSGTYRFPNP